jgi:hypothetical protein
MIDGPSICGKNRPTGPAGCRDQRHHHRRQADQQRQARALDQPRKQVAAQFVGAEDELPGAAFEPHRRRQQEVAVLLAGVVRRDPRGEQCAEHHQHMKARPATAPLLREKACQNSL